MVLTALDGWTPETARDELNEFVENGRKSERHDEAAAYLLVSFNAPLHLTAELALLTRRCQRN